MMASLHNPPSQPTTSDQVMADSDTITSTWSLARDEQQPPQQRPQRDKQPKTPKRVCTACRRRKVGCDKKQPCQNCKKAGNDCVYPPSNDANAHQMIRDERLLEQLNRLEPMFKTLASYADRGMLPAVVGSMLPEAANNNHSSPTPPTPQHSAGSGSARDQPVYRPVGTQQTATQQTPSPPGQHSQPQGSELSGGEGQSKSSKGKGTPGSAWSSLGTSTGKLVKDDGRHRYVSGTFWESLHNEGDMNGMTTGDNEDEDEDDDDDECDDDPPRPSLGSLQYALIFNSNFQQSGSDSIHPPHSHRLHAWKLFKENVHPLATILHVPSVEPLVLRAMQNTQNLAPRIEALLFVIYFGAVNSLSPDDCELQFGSPQSALLVGFRRGVDSALVCSKMMETDDMLILQTFVVYLVILRSVDPTYSWNMTGLAVRLAQALGMHRDGRLLNLSPFDAEMRRRLWWGICILDTPASEEYSGSTGVLELSSFDSRPPLNVNDSDLHPDMTDDPAESQDLTDMSFTVARCWASNVWRTMIDTRRADPDSEKSFQLMTLAERQSWVDRKSKEISGRFSGETNSRKSLHLLLSSFTGTIIKNLRFLALNPLEPGSQLDDDQRKRVLQDAIECMTHSYRLRTDSLVAHWSWLTKGYHEWHAFAIILSELSNRPLVRDATKAWQVIEQSAVLRWDSSTRHRKVHQWRSVMRGIDKARRRRKKELGRRKSANTTPSSTLPLETGPAIQQGLSNHPQAHQSDFPLLENALNHEFQVSMSQADEFMGSLLGPVDQCNFSGDDGQLYYL
ncbi:hypothetical protein DER44DRAFT_770394 [Fusarium oxysporum]|nr:hypothetical protein DER44DRAFT_770394 [Fusarium oxysporum]